MLALVAADRLGGFERLDAVEAEASQDTADGGRRDADLGSDLLAGEALAAQSLDLGDDGGRCRLAQAVRPGRTILQSVDAFGLEPGDPFARGPRADACGSCGGLRRLPALDLPNNQLSTVRRQTGILMDVHPVLRGIAEASQLQLPRSGPDGQPTESSHLGEVPLVQRG